MAASPTKLADISLMTPVLVDYRSIEQTSQIAPSLFGQLIVPPKNVVKGDSLIRDGIAPAEQLNVRALRIYQRKVQETLRLLFPVMPVLYPPPLEGIDLSIER